MGKKKTKPLSDQYKKPQVPIHLEKLIEAKVGEMGQEIYNHSMGSLRSAMLRLAALEEILISKDVATQEEVELAVADKEDASMSLASVPGSTVMAGDTVRVTATVDGKNPVKIAIDHIGTERSNRVIPPEGEEALLGQAVGGSVDVTIGETVFTMVVDRISRKVSNENITNDE